MTIMLSSILILIYVYFYPVPSIATQYLRNRKQHDSTAREWTEKYARPKPPNPLLPPLLPVVTVTPQSSAPAPAPTISARARGKRPAAEPAAVASSSGSSVIEVASDSDDEPTRVTTPRPDSVALGKRKRNITDGPESDLVGSGEVPRNSKRRPVADGTESSSPRDAHDVIVIDDD